MRATIFCFFLASLAWADAPPKASACTACHGAQGVSANDLWPNLAGQKQGYLLQQLKAFHDGVRTDPLMAPVARMLSPQEMHDLAQYYSELKVAP